MVRALRWFRESSSLVGLFEALGRSKGAQKAPRTNTREVPEIMGFGRILMVLCGLLGP